MITLSSEVTHLQILQATNIFLKCGLTLNLPFFKKLMVFWRKCTITKITGFNFDGVTLLNFQIFNIYNNYHVHTNLWNGCSNPLLCVK